MSTFLDQLEMYLKFMVKYLKLVLIHKKKLR